MKCSRCYKIIDIFTTSVVQCECHWMGFCSSICRDAHLGDEKTIQDFSGSIPISPEQLTSPAQADVDKLDVIGAMEQARANRKSELDKAVANLSALPEPPSELDNAKQSALALPTTEQQELYEWMHHALNLRIR